MLVIRNKSYQQKLIIEGFLPTDVGKLNEELEFIDKTLNDETFMEPFIEKFNKRMGRPSIPVQTGLRMMFLKFRYSMGYETLEKEVSDSFMFRNFCQIPLMEKVPDSTTLMKFAKKYGELIGKLNHILMKKYSANKINKFKKCRVDTTAVETKIQYPTDANLLAATIKKITSLVRKLKEEGMIIKNKFVDHSRKTKKHMIFIGKIAKDKTDKSKEKIIDYTKSLLKIAKSCHKKASEIVEELNTKVKFGSSKTVEKLKETLDIAQKIITQTKQVLSDKKIKDRIVSIHDKEARPIVRGKAHKKTEFGYKVSLVSNGKNIITTKVYKEAISDSNTLQENVEESKEIMGKYPDELSTDNAYYSPENVKWAEERCKRVCIPKKGKLSEEEKEKRKTCWYKRLQKFRVGIEGQISTLKRKYGLGKVEVRGFDNVVTFVNFAIFAYNLVKGP